VTGLGLRARLLTAASRRLVRPALARQGDIRAARGRFERMAQLFLPDPPRAQFLPDRLGSEELPALWASVAARDGGGVILYLHGGAFVMGSPRTHRALAARLAAAAGMAALLPAYRRAPEHPFPAALQDALLAYRTLLARGHAAGRIVLAGDSAGAGLALAVAAEIARAGWPAPAGLVGFSPLADMTFSGASMRENRARDALLPAERAGEVARLWLQGADAADPRASPLFADWPAPPPPALLFAACTEVLRDDAVRMAARLRAAGGWAEARILGDLPHVWPWLCPWLPESCATIAEAGAFLAACVARTDPAAAPQFPSKEIAKNLA
jgi:acetyl esterase/lipase